MNNCVLQKPVQLTAYRTAQEALTNVSKYAKCSLVQIDISDAEEFLTMEISDNGIGISDKSCENLPHSESAASREGAKSIGGWLDVSSKEGIGTSIILSVPLTAVPQHSAEAEFK